VRRVGIAIFTQQFQLVNFKAQRHFTDGFSLIQASVNRRNYKKMANIQYVTENRLAKEASEERKQVLSFGAPIVFVLCLIFPIAWWWFLLAYLIIVLNAGIIKRSGAKGENATLEMLSLLPDSYTIFNQVQVPNKQSRNGNTEIDFVVVGPNGVFVIEVKNNNSIIICSDEDREWLVYKVGRRGTPYTASMRNPVKQLKGQIWALNNFTKERRYKTWLEGIVFFSNPNCCLKFTGEPSATILHHSGLIDYILHHKPKYAPSNLEKFVQDLIAIKCT